MKDMLRFEDSSVEQEEAREQLRYRNPKEIIADSERAADYRFETSLLNKDGFELEGYAPSSARV